MVKGKLSHRSKSLSVIHFVFTSKQKVLKKQCAYQIITQLAVSCTTNVSKFIPLAKEYKLSAAGREDVDVKMLGNG